MTSLLGNAVATIRKHGSEDYGYWIIECDNPACKDINGRAWQQAHSRRTVEGHTIAVRNMNEHNKARHSATENGK